ncbi:glycerophosphodiester phosphodiesterase [Tenuibacillus multivorans]|uniref:Glycerophosphoryl diester phosphodiesterase n=1 Tax=Tenuibacillus multivorans TaxID=237069 RepID=A0A1H0D2D6_9BACI|nr:glycerophosphodiester phosphodiesterase [Tenuibacillus multivorans]GEL76071.1 glycerophosphoryl diester phosphodiesterase [Tenuibacillus multivorans]SDN64226.1 glycerophosphoryl diester phosphodiesterase [Tenuibacillus multivorans]
MFTISTQIFAHRGASRYAPENTLPAFEMAHEIGVDGIELDVQLTKDLIPVITHDENIRRTTNGTGFVQNYTLEELQQFDAGFWFSKRFYNTPIMSLNEFLHWVKDKNLLINLELKTNVIEYPTIEKRVLEQLYDLDLISRTVISSFNPQTIQRVRELDHDIELAWLTKIQVRRIQDFISEIGANAVHIRSRLLSSKMVKFMIEEQIPYRVYTVNRVSLMRKCVTMGADGIFTDIPDIMQINKS